VQLAGTPFSLHYSSDRVRGRADNFTLPFVLSNSTVPSSLKRIDLEVLVGGTVTNRSFSAQPNQTTTFVWDGKDAFGRTLQGAEPVTAVVRYVYDIVYGRTNSFGSSPGVSITGNRSLGEIYLERRLETTLGVPFDSRAIGLGGWSLSAQHAYDVNKRLLLLGDGSRRGAAAKPLSLASTGMFYPKDMVNAPDGSLYVLRNNGCQINRLSLSGDATSVAGTGTCGFSGDGGPAVAAAIRANSIALGLDGSLYLTQDNRVRRVGPSGTITTVAGTGVNGWTGNEGLATAATLFNPYYLAVAPDGSVYISEAYSIRRLDTAGIIHQFAGDPFRRLAEVNEVPATESSVNTPFIAVSPSGEVFISGSSSGGAIRRIDNSGTIHRFAGCNGCAAGLNDGIPALLAWMGDQPRVRVAENGDVYFTDGSPFSPGDQGSVFVVRNDGVIRRVAGAAAHTASSTRSFSPGMIATQLDGVSTSFQHGLAVGPRGVYMVADSDGSVVLATPALPGFTVGNILIPSVDGTELYVFDSAGRHLSTQSTLTRATLYTLGYSAGRLSTVTDGNNNITTIEHDAFGNPTAIVGPFGQRTVLAVDANGYLNRVTDPLGNTTSATYSPDGLMLSFTDPRGFTGNMTYDASGRLQTDVDAAGASQTLTPAGNKSNWQSSFKTGENRTTNYTIVRPGSGEEQRVNTFPDGTQITDSTKNDGTHITTFPDGTIVTTTVAADTRWGQDAPLYSTTTKLPSGLTRTESQSRNAALSNPADPLSLITLQDAFTLNGRTTRRVFNASTKTFTTTTPVGRKLFNTIDTLGHVTQTQTNGLDGLSYLYDIQGRIKTVTQGPRQLALSYFSTSDGKNGYLQQITDALARTTSFDRDAFGRVLSQVEPGNATTGFGWDQTGNLTAITPPGKPQHKQGYSPAGLLSSYTPPQVSGVLTPATNFAYNLDRQDTTTVRPDGLTLQSTYDSAGKLRTKTWPTGTVAYDYYATTTCVGCAPGKLKRLSGPGTSVIDLTYDGRLTKSARWSGIFGGTTSMGVAWTYDSDFRVIQEAIDAGTVTTTAKFAFDADGLVTCASPTTCTPPGTDALQLAYSSVTGLIAAGTLGNLAETWTQNAQGELATYTVKNGATTLYAAEYDTPTAPRDALGRILTKRETTASGSVRFQYSYDPRGRLTGVNKDGAVQTSYVYDSNGNRQSMTNSSGTTLGSFDDQDRMLAYGNNAYTYTANGELLTKKDTVSNSTTSYQYDVRGALRSVDLPNGKAIDYVIDAYGRRVGKKVNGVFTRGWIYRDSLKIAGETDGAGTLVSQFVYARGARASHSPEFMLKGGQIYRFIKDQVGSIRLVVNASTGQVAQELIYDEFGRVLSDSSSGFQPFGFAGGIFDSDTGFVRFGARDYDAQIGRWTSKDPSRFAGGNNLYVYSWNDPVNYLDATGRAPFLSEQQALEWIKHQLDRIASYPDAVDAFLDNYDDMRDANTIGADKYFHCMANCEAAARGRADVAETISDTREWVDENLKGDPASACSADQTANHHGRNSGADDKDQCRQACSPYRPNGLNPQY